MRSLIVCDAPTGPCWLSKTCEHTSCLGRRASTGLSNDANQSSKHNQSPNSSSSLDVVAVAIGKTAVAAASDSAALVDTVATPWSMRVYMTHKAFTKSSGKQERLPALWCTPYTCHLWAGLCDQSMQHFPALHWHGLLEGCHFDQQHADFMLQGRFHY